MPNTYVSIPYRYGTTEQKMTNINSSITCQFLIGTVPRYGKQFSYNNVLSCVNSL